MTRLPRALTAHDVFTPGAFPEHTYVAREDEDLEAKLRFALKTRGQIVSLSGPSKSGKTVLVEKVVGKEHLVPVVGAGIRDAEQIWSRALDVLAVPADVTETTGVEARTAYRAGGSASGSVAIVRADASASVEHRASKTATEATRQLRRGLEQVIEQIAGTDDVLLVDDFHYMPRDVQAEVAKQLKEAARRDVKIVTAQVPHRADDVVRANPELRGRVTAIDVGYWPAADLVRIAEAGFSALDVEISPASAKALAEEAAGSPQLMQALCLYACFVMGTTERQPKRVARRLERAELEKVCRLTATVCDFRSLVDVLDPGPRARGVERKTYRFTDGTTGDVYRAVLKAIAGEPRALSFSYEDLSARVRAMADGESPPGSSLFAACAHMHKLALDHLPNVRVLEWDDTQHVLDIPDPYFLFYLRWSDRLRQGDEG